MVAQVGARLGGLIMQGQRAFAVAVDDGDRTPLAHVNCDEFSVDLLSDLAQHATELMALGSVVSAQGIVAVLDRFQCAIWLERSFLHVIVDGDGMAFNRLVSQLAHINP
jgi:hypothetical protein